MRVLLKASQVLMHQLMNFSIYELSINFSIYELSFNFSMNYLLTSLSVNYQISWVAHQTFLFLAGIVEMVEVGAASVAGREVGDAIHPTDRLDVVRGACTVLVTRGRQVRLKDLVARTGQREKSSNHWYKSTPRNVNQWFWLWRLASLCHWLRAEKIS